MGTKLFDEFLQRVAIEQNHIKGINLYVLQIDAFQIQETFYFQSTFPNRH